ncbi:MAG: aminomethyltransferase family protein, partial [Myxococcales bacterium]|nr:aminomethyltransferase family protein [Myxococcales bacterium]
LCESMLWKHWAGYYAVRSYEKSHEREYFAFRHSAGLMDVTPLYKYEVHGPDAGPFLARVLSKDVRTLREGRVTYLCWCDDDGKIMDDGTVSRMEENRYRITAAEPSYAWFARHARGYDVTIEDTTERFGILALQGPTSRAILEDATDADLGKVRFFSFKQTKLGDKSVTISRTGYTGDLGYEVWCEAGDALPVWDGLIAAGARHRIVPAGLDALDVARIEAGFIMNGVDYHSANRCFVESRKSSPFEVGLGWTVKTDRDPFIGQKALVREERKGSPFALAGLVYDWDEYEAAFAAKDLPPSVDGAAWRTPVPVYDRDGQQVGYATSGAWSPILKRNLALATVDRRHAKVGTRLEIEVTVEFERQRVGVTVEKTPFFDPERKRA